VGQPSPATTRVRAEEPEGDRGKATGRAGRDEAPAEKKRGRSPKAEKEQEPELTKLSAQQYTVKGHKVWPGKDPDIGVLEIRDDGSMYVVTANRADVMKKAGAPSHMALARHPDGLGPPIAGARRYRLYLGGGKATNVEPLDHASQSADLVRAVGQALKDTGLVSPSGTKVDLSLGSRDPRLKDTIKPSP
jgi:hypothetical protein